MLIDTQDSVVRRASAYDVCMQSKNKHAGRPLCRWFFLCRHSTVQIQATVAYAITFVRTLRIRPPSPIAPLNLAVPSARSVPRAKTTTTRVMVPRAAERNAQSVLVVNFFVHFKVFTGSSWPCNYPIHSSKKERTTKFVAICLSPQLLITNVPDRKMRIKCSVPFAPPALVLSLTICHFQGFQIVLCGFLWN